MNFAEWFYATHGLSKLQDAEDELKWMLTVNDWSHRGDCTKENYTCQLCLLETLLSEYYEYFKKEKANEVHRRDV